MEFTTRGEYSPVNVLSQRTAGLGYNRHQVSRRNIIDTRSVAEMEVDGRVTHREAVRSRAVGFPETGVAQTAAAKKFGVHRTTIYRWWKRYCEVEMLADKKLSGRSRGARLKQGWICRLPGARENITVCGVAPVPASTHRVS